LILQKKGYCFLKNGANKLNIEISLHPNYQNPTNHTNYKEKP
jgi:hypothetical protein